MLADIFTPVGIYLRLRDKFPGSILLESTDYRASENSYSYICVKPIAGIEVTSLSKFEFLELRLDDIIKELNLYHNKICRSVLGIPWLVAK